MQSQPASGPTRSNPKRVPLSGVEPASLNQALKLFMSPIGAGISPLNEEEALRACAIAHELQRVRPLTREERRLALMYDETLLRLQREHGRALRTENIGMEDDTSDLHVACAEGRMALLRVVGLAGYHMRACYEPRRLSGTFLVPVRGCPDPLPYVKLKHFEPTPTSAIPYVVGVAVYRRDIGSSSSGHGERVVATLARMGHPSGAVLPASILRSIARTRDDMDREGRSASAYYGADKRKSAVDYELWRSDLAKRGRALVKQNKITLNVLLPG